MVCQEDRSEDRVFLALSPRVFGFRVRLGKVGVVFLEHIVLVAVAELGGEVVGLRAAFVF
jgi:hypothetical protein